MAKHGGGRRRLTTGASLAAVVLLIGGGAAALFAVATDRILKDYAARQAQTWAFSLSGASLEEMAATAPTGSPRFVLYGAEGRWVAGSTGRPAPALPLAAPRMWADLSEGRAVVALTHADTDGDAGRTAALVHLPLTGPEGERLGAAAVTLDLTGARAALGATLTGLGLGLLGLAALTLGLPALSWRLAGRRDDLPERAWAPQVDPLTGLPDRASFSTAAEQLLERGGACAVVLADIDGFRALNETQGRHEGDALVRRVGVAFRAALRGSDPAGRLGADEFAAVVSLLRADDLDALVLRIAGRVSAAAGPAACASVSLGASLVGPGGGPGALDDALRRAAIALMDAKAAGGGTARTFRPEMERCLIRRRQVERAVREGRAAGRFTLAYQPLVESRGRETRGFEALMRLTDASGTPISPVEFIPVAESTGLINELGAWALFTATQAAAGWPDRLSVSVNLSVQQFRGGQLVDTVRKALTASGLAPDRLELEVTESLLISDPDEVRRQLEALKGLGVSLAMDDFGTGHSSLAYLWRYGFDRLKLDRGFVEALAEDEGRARDVIGAIVALSHRLGMNVTAEGIETEEEALVLTGLGCDALQGFRFGRPLHATELAEVLRWSIDARREKAEAERLVPPREAVGGAGG